MDETPSDTIWSPNQKLLKGQLGGLLVLLAARAHPRGKEFLQMRILISLTSFDGTDNFMTSLFAGQSTQPLICFVPHFWYSSPLGHLFLAHVRTVSILDPHSQNSLLTPQFSLKTKTHMNRGLKGQGIQLFTTSPKISVFHNFASKNGNREVVY